MSKLSKELEGRKSLHFNIRANAHSALRIACFKNKITMQDFFNEISQLVEIEDQHMISIIKDLSDRKRSKAIEKISVSDTDDLYDIIEKSVGKE